MKLNRNVLIVLLLLSVFAVGTLHFADTVEAAAWKKYDSGKQVDNYPYAGHKKVMSYQSYTNGNNQLYVDVFAHSKKTGKKELTQRVVLTKKNNIVEVTEKNYFSKETSTSYVQTKLSVKNLYKSMMKEMKKMNSVTPAKAAFDTQSFTVLGSKYKVYSIQHYKDSIGVYVYNKGEEYGRFSVEYVYGMIHNKKVIENKILYRNYDKRMKLVSKQTFNPSQSITSIYKTKLNKLIKQIKNS